MKRLLTLIALALTFGMLGLIAGEAAKIGGNWQIAMDTPHGPMKGALVMKQDGSKLSGTLETDHFGKLDLTGSVDGNSVSFEVDVQGHLVKFNGSVDGGKMSGGTDPDAVSWTATRQ